jgi:hypothetical protein
MIRVEREVKGKNGKYRYRVPEYGVESGLSRQPLLDACRAVSQWALTPPGK